MFRTLLWFIVICLTIAALLAFGPVVLTYVAIALVLRGLLFAIDKVEKQ